MVLENATYVILHVHILRGHLLRNASVDFHTMDGTALGMFKYIILSFMNCYCCTVLLTIITTNNTPHYKICVLLRDYLLIACVNAQQAKS